MRALRQWLGPCLGASLILWVGACKPDPPAPGSDGDGTATAVTAVETAAASASAGAPSATLGSAQDDPPPARVYDRPELAIQNLERLIGNQQRALDKGSPDILPRLQLIGLLSERASRLGQMRDLDTIAVLGDELIERYAERPAAWLGRARALNVVHRFDEALAALDKAKKLGAEPGKIDALRAVALMGLGRYPEAHKLFKAQRETFAEPNSLTLEAIALGRLGRVEEADAQFKKAQASYKRLSPMVPAWIHFEHGNLWARQGDDKRAAHHYQEAVNLVPQYAHAAAHLAGLRSDDKAIALFEKLIKSSDDPEYPASLARLLEKRDAERSATLMRDALAAYDELLAKHEAAFADHAGWFYLEAPGKLDRARELVDRAVKARGGVPEIHELRLAVVMRQGKQNDICTALKAADKLPHKTAGLKLWMDAARKKCP